MFLLCVAAALACGGNGVEPVVVRDNAFNLTACPTERDQNPAFSPDGATILFSSTRGGAGGNLNLWTMSSTGANQAPLTQDRHATHVNAPGSSWNAPTNRICFSSDRSGNEELWTVAPDGSDLRQITDHPARDRAPSFSPCGEWIAFQSDRDGNWEIYRIHLGTGEVVRLTRDPGDDAKPNWGPRGDRIVFRSDRSGNWDLYTMRPDGTDVCRVTDDPEDDTDPSWGPDQSMIVFSSDRGGTGDADIWVLRTGDGSTLQVTFDPAYDGAPSFSPDGSWIVFESSRGGDLDIWRIPSPSAPLSWETVNDFVYQLQDLSIEALGQTRFDLVIMDYSADGSDEARFTPERIAWLKESPGGPKLVVAYMSIGEAEDYRWYWDGSWDGNHDGVPDPGAPAWLGRSNPEWAGNYKVRYWDPEWHEIIYSGPDSYLRKLVDAGFDGVYLDVIDAYEYWGPGGESRENRASAEQEMVDFVLAIASYARTTLQKPSFGIFPQNGEELLRHSDYLHAVTGIGLEDTWYDGNPPQPPSHTAAVVAALDAFRRAGKLVLVTDYVTIRPLIDDFYAKALSRGFVPYATVRDLDVLTVNQVTRPIEGRALPPCVTAGPSGARHERTRVPLAPARRRPPRSKPPRPQGGGLVRPAGATTGEGAYRRRMTRSERPLSSRMR